MPWSEWVQADPYETPLEVKARWQLTKQLGFDEPFPPNGDWLLYTEPGDTWIGVVADQIALPSDAAVVPPVSLDPTDVSRVGAAGVGDADPQTEHVHYIGTGNQLYVSLGLSTAVVEWRDEFPEALWTLTEGEDYEQIGVDAEGNAVYVEYEDGDVELTDVADIRITFGSSGAEFNNSGDLHVIQSYLRVLGSSDMHWQQANPPDATYHDAASWQRLPGEAASNPEVTFDPTGYMTVDAPLMVLLANGYQPSIPFPAGSPPEAGTPLTGGSVSNPTVQAAVMYRQPRFRYWIPGIPPLRLNQRDDDLGLSPSPRQPGFATTQQSSIRAGGNTYI